MDETLRQALSKRNIRAFETTIKRSTKYGEASMSRQLVVTMYPRSEHTRAYKSLLAEMLKVIGGPGLGRASLLTERPAEDVEQDSELVATHAGEV